MRELMFSMFCLGFECRKTYEFLKELVKRGEEGEGKPQFVL